MKSLIAKKENDIDEKGVQIRTANPSSPLSNQLWMNTSTKRMVFYDGMMKELFAGYVEGSEPSKVVEFPLVNIDWSLGTIFRKVNISGTVNLTFSNVTEGKTIVIVVITDSLLTATLGFPVGTKLQASDVYSLPKGKGVAVEVSRINGITYARIIFKADLAKFPYGPLGDLTITSGQTVNITNGSIVDYNNLTIQAGGTLNIVGAASGNITVIGVKNNLVINGTIKANDGTFGTSTFSLVTPNNESVSYTSTQRSAGAGAPGTYPAGNGGGAGTLGYGGGGGGGGDSDQSRGWGGHGGVNNGPGTYAPNNLEPGAGNVSLGNGYTGTQDGRPVYLGKHGGGSGGGGGKSGSAGGGGGGAFKGKHGLGLYIYVLGSISGSGQVQMNGLNGFNGGAGNLNGSKGGGGGGGAGGNGGSLWVRSPAPFTVPYTISAGTGGVGGAAPQAGGNGQSGNVGTFNWSPNAGA
jgi:hypothetical protein